MVTYSFFLLAFTYQIVSDTTPSGIFQEVTTEVYQTSTVRPLSTFPSGVQYYEADHSNLDIVGVSFFTLT